MTTALSKLAGDMLEKARVSAREQSRRLLDEQLLGMAYGGGQQPTIYTTPKEALRDLRARAHVLGGMLDSRMSPSPSLHRVPARARSAAAGGKSVSAAVARLELIMEKGPHGAMELWACRGKGNGCLGVGKREKHCEACVLGREDETLEQLMARIKPS